MSDKHWKFVLIGTEHLGDFSLTSFSGSTVREKSFTLVKISRLLESLHESIMSIDISSEHNKSELVFLED